MLLAVVGLGVIILGARVLVAATLIQDLREREERE